MKDAGINISDSVAIQPAKNAASGQIVLSLVDNVDSTIKFFFHHGSEIELRPANKKYRKFRKYLNTCSGIRVQIIPELLLK